MVKIIVNNSIVSSHTISNKYILYIVLHLMSHEFLLSMLKIFSYKQIAHFDDTKSLCFMRCNIG